jgi:RNA polymerase sigma-70 factor (ECF subfamily)
VTRESQDEHEQGPGSEMSQAARDPAVLLAVRAHASPDEPVEATLTPAAARHADRLRSVVAEHYPSLWRFLRRLGVPEADAEDAAQKCLCVLAQRIDDVGPGKDKPFLFAVAVRVAKAMRRERRFATSACDDERLSELPSLGPDAGQQLDERRARVVLDALLASLPLDLRTVFVLYEIEELTMAEIARALDLPMGTVASRLRRARETFEELSRRVRRDIGRKEGLR